MLLVPGFNGFFFDIGLVLDAALVFYVFLGCASIGYVFFRAGFGKPKAIAHEYKLGWSILLGLTFSILVTFFSLGASIFRLANLGFGELLFVFVDSTFIAGILMIVGGTKAASVLLKTKSQHEFSGAVQKKLPKKEAVFLEQKIEPTKTREELEESNLFEFDMPDFDKESTKSTQENALTARDDKPKPQEKKVLAQEKIDEQEKLKEKLAKIEEVQENAVKKNETVQETPRPKNLGAVIPQKAVKEKVHAKNNALKEEYDEEELLRKDIEKVKKWQKEIREKSVQEKTLPKETPLERLLREKKEKIEKLKEESRNE